MVARSNTIESRTFACESMVAHGPMTLRSTCAPDSRHPRETIESTVAPVLPLASRTNFAGGRFVCWLKIGQSWLYRLKTGTGAMRSMCASKNESIVPTSRQ